MQHNLNVDVVDKADILGMKLARMTNSIKSKKEAKNINKYIFGQLSAFFNSFFFLWLNL